MRKTLAIAAGVLILVLANWSIYSREKLLTEGRIVYLELAPVDPRSLMQGDYMALRFQVANDLRQHNANAALKDGKVVLAIDSQGVGKIAHLEDGTTLGPMEVRMHYRVRNGQIKFATNGWFFQEGTADLYAKARYGEFRVADSGDSILTAMRDEKLEVLGPPSPQPSPTRGEGASETSAR